LGLTTGPEKQPEKGLKTPGGHRKGDLGPGGHLLRTKPRQEPTTGDSPGGNMKGGLRVSTGGPMKTENEREEATAMER